MTNAYHNHVLGAFRRVVHTARGLRHPPPPLTAVPVDYPLPDPSLDAEFEEVLIEASGPGGPPPTALSLYAESGGIDDRTALVRSDTAVSYPDFIASVSAEFAELQSRMSALEAAMAAHAGDPNAHRKVEQAAQAVLGASARANDAAIRDAIPAVVEPESASKIMPWRSGDHVCVTICFPAVVGSVRYVTGSTPVAVEAARMAQYVDASGVAPVDVLGCVGPLCNVLGAGRVVSTICAGAPDLLALDSALRVGPGPVLARVQPAVRPSARAILSLAARCADGNEGAMVEWDALGEAAERIGAAGVASAMNDAAEAVR